VTRSASQLALVEREEPRGRVRLALVDGRGAAAVDACELTIDPLTLHDGGGGLVPVGGIGNVATRPSHRRQGLATQLLEVAIERMRASDMAASLLYGIDGFYEPLGWRSCGDERWVQLPLDGWRDTPSSAARARALQAPDLPRIHELYEQLAAATPGAVHRTGTHAWARLDPAEVDVVERDGDLVGWCWRGVGLPERDDAQSSRQRTVAFAELQAVDQDAMLAVLDAAVARARRDEHVPDASALVTGADDTHLLRRLARLGLVEATLVDEVRPRGGPMLLAFDDRGRALLGRGDLYQFLPDRF
jgi:GNAT superfamily N-acetyltransferase